MSLITADATTKPPARTGPNVPCEFVGQAWLFRNRIDAAAKIASAATQRIGVDARTIVRRRRTWRSEHFPGFERQWRLTMPDEGGIGLAVGRSMHALTIAEFRLSLSSDKDIRWSKPFPKTLRPHAMHVPVDDARRFRSYSAANRDPRNPCRCPPVPARFRQYRLCHTNRHLRAVIECLSTSWHRQPSL